MSLISRSVFVVMAPPLLASAALADLTAEDVWSDWRAYSEGFGYTMQGTEAETADGLTITGVIFSNTDVDGAGSVSIRMERIVLTEEDDGTVTIVLPTLAPIEMTTLDADGQPISISMDYRQTGLNLSASGTPDALSYTYGAQEFSVVSTGFQRAGQPVSDASVDFEFVIDNPEGVTNVTGSELLSYDQNLSASAMRYAFNFATPNGQETANLSGQLQSVSVTGQSALPTTVDNPNDIEEMIKAGFSTNGAFSFQANALTLSTTSPGDATEMSFISDNGQLGITLGTAGLKYEASQENVQVETRSNQIPLPIDFSAAGAAFNFAMPVMQSEQFGDFALGIVLDALSLSDAIWGLFDPGAQIPRTPATLMLDVTGKTRLLFNFLDATEVPNLAPGQMPAELESLDINTLRLQAAGTELTGDGAFTFENSEFGPPKPIGALNLTLVGGNTLINQLVATGLLPEDQAMGMRMMMGLLAIPGDAPDTLNSRIEINEQGHVLANGQRIQ